MSGWDGRSYDSISAPHAQMGAPALERLQLRGNELVLDAGCGSGRLTERLLERLPRGSVVALDGAEAMLREARRRMARFGDRVTYVKADLSHPPLPLEVPVDAILSTATFHWILDHDALFEGLAGALRPGGRLSVQCGGEGNYAAVIGAARAEGVETAGRFNFASAGDTVDRLARSGFVEANAWLTSETISFDSREDAVEYVVTPYLRPATGLPDDQLRELGGAVIDRVGGLSIDYVRLNITARRA